MYFSAQLGTAGLADVGYEWYDNTESSLGARSTSGVIESGDGWYSAELTPPAGATSIRWDSTGTASAFAREYFSPSLPLAVPGAANGLLIAGSNAATTFVTLTSSGAFTVDYINVTNALNIGTGMGIGGNLIVGGVVDVTGSVGFGDVFTVSGLVTFGAGFTVVGSMTVDTNAIPWNADWTADVLTTLGMASSDLDTQLDAILAAAGGGTGGGANVVTITVDDGADPLENAIVRLAEGVNSYSTTTDASGDAVFSLDDATYTLTITKGGYSFTPTTQVVSGTTSETKSMAQIVAPTPSSPELCVVTGTFTEPDGTALVSADIVFRLVAARNITTGGVLVQETEWTVTTDANGEISTELVRTDQFKRPNAHYLVTCTELGWNKKRLTLAAAAYDLSSL